MAVSYDNEMIAQTFSGLKALHLIIAVALPKINIYQTKIRKQNIVICRWRTDLVLFEIWCRDKPHNIKLHIKRLIISDNQPTRPGIIGEQNCISNNVMDCRRTDIPVQISSLFVTKLVSIVNQILKEKQII